MKKIYVATKLRAEDCDGSDVSVLAVGSFEDCKKPFVLLGKRLLNTKTLATLTKPKSANGLAMLKTVEAIH